MEINMIIGVCGYGYSGSDAMADLLREFEDCDTQTSKQTHEFLFPYCPHGLQDLEYHLVYGGTRYFSSDIAIKEYRRLVKTVSEPWYKPWRHLKGVMAATDEYISSITDTSWNGYSWYEVYCSDNRTRNFFNFVLLSRVVNIYERIFKHSCPVSVGGKMYLSVCPESFVEKTKVYMRKVLACLNFDMTKKIVLNQPFDVNNPARSMKFFDNAKAIILERDPRDVYILVKKALPSTVSFIPTDNVEKFIRYFRLNRKMNITMEDSDVLRINFEDMVYDYEKTCKMIIKFLDLGSSTWKRKTFFKPEISIDNTQLFLCYPELNDDIKKIEKELSEYLYPFEKFLIIPKHKNAPF